MSDHPSLFKYMTATTAVSVLNNCTLRWTTPRTLNDPYDVQFDLHIEGDRAAVKEAALGKLWVAHYGNTPSEPGNILGAIIKALRGRFPKLSREEFDREFGEAIDESLDAGERALPRFQAEMREQFKSSKILCLTSEPCSNLMWTHYADSHNGVVLKFRSVRELDSCWCMAKPMNYVAAMPRLLDTDFLADLLSGAAKMIPDVLVDRMIYTKSTEWEYEREWRIYSGDGRNPAADYEDIPFHPLELEALIFGCRTSREIRLNLMEVVRANYPYARLFEIQLADREFNLRIEPLNV